jgi:hypothetical protein
LNIEAAVRVGIGVGFSVSPTPAEELSMDRFDAPLSASGPTGNHAHPGAVPPRAWSVVDRLQ